VIKIEKRRPVSWNGFPLNPLLKRESDAELEHDFPKRNLDLVVDVLAGLYAEPVCPGIPISERE
jgi:hypothetical protein